MRQIIAAGIFVLLVAFHAQGAASFTGEYKTKQTNLSGTLLVKQLPGKLVLGLPVNLASGRPLLKYE